MINYKYSDLFWQGSVDKQWRIEYDGGMITNESLFSQSIELTESLCSGSELRFGSCEASALKFKIGNVVQPLLGKWLTVSVVLDRHEDEPFLVGRYKVASDKVTSDRRHREIIAYDAMYDIINSSVIEWYNTILPDKDSKVKMKQFRTSFVHYFGLEEADPVIWSNSEGTALLYGLVNDDMDVEKTISVGEGEEISSDTEQISVIKESSLSGLNVINAICEINGCFGHIGRDGKFHYVYLDQAIEGLYPAEDLLPDHAPEHMVQAKTGHLYPQDPASCRIDKSNYIECHWEDFVTKRITKLQIRQKENDIGAVWPDKETSPDDNCYIIEDNFLVYGKNAEQLQNIAKNIFGKITDIVYRPFDADLRGNLCFEVGDAVSIPTKYEIVESYVLGRSLKGIQALRDDFSAKGVERYSEKVNSVSRSIIQLKGKTNTLERNVEKTVSQIEDVESGLSSRITQLADGISMEVTNGADGKTAEIKLYVKDGETVHEVNADKIDFTGLVSFQNLKTGGETVINGENLITGTVSCDVLNGGTINGQKIVGGYIEGTDIKGVTITGANIIANEFTAIDKIKIRNYDNTRSVTLEVFTGGSTDILFIDKQVMVEKTFTAGAIESYGHIRLRKTNEDTGKIDTQRITALYKDERVHDVISVSDDLLTTGIGWSGKGNDNKSYNSVLNLRGKTVNAPDNSGVTVTSDERLKNSFKPLDEFDDVYMDIEPCAFKYNNGTSGRYHFGVKAQNVKEAFEKHGYTTKDFAGFVQMHEDPESEDYCGIDDPMGIIYTEFTMWNTRMIQKLYKKIEEQKKRIEDLEEVITSLKERMPE